MTHQCRWTARRETELSDRDGGLYGSGVHSDLLARMATLLAAPLTTGPDTADPNGELLAFGDLATGSIHDDCFIYLAPVSAELKGALLDAVLAQHADYLERVVDWQRVRSVLLEHWSRNVRLRMQSFPATGRVVVRYIGAEGAILNRLFAKTIEIDCARSPADIVE